MENINWDEKLKQLTQQQIADHKRMNKLLCSNYPLRNERFGDRKAKIQWEITMRQHNLDRLEQEAAPIRAQIASLQKDLAKVIKDHEDFEDHQFYVGAPLSVIAMDSAQEIKALEQKKASLERMIQGINDRIARIRKP